VPTVHGIATPHHWPFPSHGRHNIVYTLLFNFCSESKVNNIIQCQAVSAAATTGVRTGQMTPVI